ncbi:MAG TPA: hypothetical protein VNE82_16660 [Candidatus Binataceae bacterium]|nr:hypothetical protein [Candidatus Binataceae bacterium]
MTEQLGLDQRLDKGAAIERDEGEAPARAGVMDEAGRQFLAGPGLANDQDIGGAGRNAVEPRFELARCSVLENEGDSPDRRPAYLLRQRCQRQHVGAIRTSDGLPTNFGKPPVAAIRHQSDA